VVGASYTLRVRDHDTRLGSEEVSIGPIAVASAPDPITLGPTQLVQGDLSGPSGQVKSALVEFFCDTCDLRGEPWAAGQTDAAGRFRIRLRDPGTDP
jgi:hypothetical protein